MRDLRIPLIALVALIAASSNAGAQEALRVAAAGPFTGPLASFGEQMRNGAEFAVADINAAGGVLGRKLVLELGDDQCDPKQAVSAANYLVSKGTVAVIGHFCSSSSIPASAIYHEAGIPMITPASTNPALTDEAAAKGWQEIFRVCGRDDAQGAVSGRYLAEHFMGKKVAIIQDKSSFGRGVADETKKAMNEAGLQEVLYDSITAGEKDFSAIITKLKEIGVDAVYFGGYQVEAALLIKQSREQGLKAVFIASDGILTDDFWQIAGPAAAGTLMTHPPDPRDKPTAKAVVEAFKANGKSPDGFALYTYAAFQVLAEAAKRGGGTEPENIIAGLRSGRPFDTVIGSLSLDGKGDVKNPEYILYEWKDGNYHALQ